MDYETHIPAKQSCPQAPARFSFAHCHQGRTQDYRAPPGKGAETAVGLIPLESVKSMDRLKKRAEFVEVSKGARLHRAAFSLQAKRRPIAAGGPRVGFTVTRKTGNAVERNRIRRRLGAAVNEARTSAASGIDYVLIGRRKALTIAFDAMRDDVQSAFRSIDPDRPPKGRAHTRGDKRGGQ